MAAENSGLLLEQRREGENNREYALRVLRENIMALRLAPGTKIHEAEWCEWLGISRTPVHEAVQALKDQYLVEVIPQKASVVTRIDLGLVSEGYFLRSTVEPAVFTHACGTLSPEILERLGENLKQQEKLVEVGDAERFVALDTEFHRMVYEGDRKPHIWQAIGSVSSHFERIRHFDALKIEANTAHSFEEHKKLYYSLVSGSVAAIESLYPGHLAFYQETLPQLLEEWPNYFKM